MNKCITFLIFAVMFLAACREEQSPETPYNGSRETEKFEVSYVQNWMQTAYRAVRNQGVFALEASRVYSYLSVAMYESMVYGLPEGKSLQGQLEGLQNLPKPSQDLEYNWLLVMNTAANDVLEKTFTAVSQSTQRLIWDFSQSQRDDIINQYKVSNEVVKNSFDYGKLLGQALIDWSAGDRTSEISTLPFEMPPLTNNPQYFDGNGVGTPFFMMPFWWASRPFAIPHSKVCLPDAPYEYSEDPNSLYYKDVLEVYQATKDPAKLAIGQYWANNPGQSGTPAGSWIGIANQLVDQFDLKILDALKMYVLLSISTRDTFLAVWYTKYKWNLQRPVSYIRKMMNEPQWVSPVPTPPYPDYVSGTSANAGSSSTILTSLFGNRSFSDAQHIDKQFPIKQYVNFREAGIEAYHSRIYAGVHMRKACEEGFRQGECVANLIMNHIDFGK